MKNSPTRKQIQKVDDESLSITRKRYGRGFQYFNEFGEKITDKALLRRLRKLIIPPMWDAVHICKWSDGHIQATGRDLKGRKQYIYHSEWERMRQEAKFAKMAEFGRQLPVIRKAAMKHISQKGWGKEKVLSLMIFILDETGIRIGNRQYANRNGTYGLSTLRRKHVHLSEESMIFEFKGKSGKLRHVEIDDEELIQMVRKSAEQPGYELFRYQDTNGSFTNIDSEDVNTFIREHGSEEFSSKDFRTWVASRLAIEFYPEALHISKVKKRKKFTNILLRLVADALGNTPTVCRSYYVHPIVMQAIEGQCIKVLKEDHETFQTELSSSEQYLLELIS